MKHQHQTIQDTKSGTAETYIAEREQKKKILDKLEKFHSDVEIEKLIAQDNGLPIAVVEAPREIIEHFNRGRLIQAFDKAGYFIYNGVAVCETGKKAKVTEAMDQSSVLMPDDWNKKKAQ
jgi:hypothetical protein